MLKKHYPNFDWSMRQAKLWNHEASTNVYTGFFKLSLKLFSCSSVALTISSTLWNSAFFSHISFWSCFIFCSLSPSNNLDFLSLLLSWDSFHSVFRINCLTPSFAFFRASALLTASEVLDWIWLPIFASSKPFPGLPQLLQPESKGHWSHSHHRNGTNSKMWSPEILVEGFLRSVCLQFPHQTLHQDHFFQYHGIPNVKFALSSAPVRICVYYLSRPEQGLLDHNT